MYLLIDSYENTRGRQINLEFAILSVLWNEDESDLIKLNIYRRLMFLINEAECFHKHPGNDNSTTKRRSY